MAYRFTILEKVNLFKITLSSLNDYDPYLKSVFPLLQRLYLLERANRFSSSEAAAHVVQLEIMMNDLQQKIKKQDNFQAVIQQVFFYTHI
ncbi:MAG: hypothetical protein JWN56_2973 [Sphingobacteriales bacterium]|nr:hypothetical protein [Sphingobacteriales bacterium]